LILTFTLVRLSIRTGTAKPEEAPTGSALLDRVAWWSHRLLYVTVFGMVGSGLIVALQARLPEVVFFGRGQLPPDFWVFPLRSVHYALSRLLMALIALHVCSAFYHVTVRRDRLFRRMWFGRRFGDQSALASAQRSRAASFWDYAPWLNRAILALPLLLFVLIGFKYLATPDKVAAGSGMLLQSQAAVTDLRVEGAVFFCARRAHAVVASGHAADSGRPRPDCDGGRFRHRRARPRLCCRRASGRNDFQACSRSRAAHALLRRHSGRAWAASPPDARSASRS
jgi:hypothetical protein